MSIQTPPNPPSSLKQCSERLRVMLRSNPDLRIVAIELCLTAALAAGMSNERDMLVEYARQLVRDMQDQEPML